MKKAGLAGKANQWCPTGAIQLEEGKNSKEVLLLRVLDYFQPLALEAAFSCLQKSPGTTKLLAGGTDLIIQMKERSVEADYIVDLANILELKGIVQDGDNLVIGSMVTFSEIEHNHLINKYIPLLAKAAGTVGSPQIRNTATIGGNIANAAVAADSLPALLALEAKVRLQKINAQKDVAIEDILVGANKTCIAPDEILTKIIIPIPQANTAMTFIKIGRRKALAIARLNLGLTLSMDMGRKTKKASLALGAVGVTAYRVPQVEELLMGKAINEDTITAACNLISEVVSEKLGTRSTASYKMAVAKAALSKALENVKAELEGD